MGLLDKLFGSSDPSTQWKADPDIPIELDLGRPALCGIQLGDHSDRIARLGPPDNPRPSKDETYRYDRHGFVIDANDRSVCCFTIAFDKNAPDVETEEFRGTVLHKGQPIDLRASTCEDEFCQQFGAPYWRDVDDQEHLLFYEFGKVEWQIEFGNKGGLRVLTIVTPPLLSDPEQRENYNIDRPWPPA